MMEVNPTRKTKIWATLAGIAIEAPILGLMGFSFFSSIILLVVSSPLLIIFSPLLIGAAVAGFGVAGVTAGLGLSSFVLVYRSVLKGRITGGEYGGGADDAPVIVDKMIQPAETEEEHDTEVAGTDDRTEAIKQQQPQQGSTSSEPVHVDRIVELFESLKEHPHDQNETATIVHVVTVEVDADDDDELEENRHNKDMATSGVYLQQNVPRQIPPET